MQVKLPAIIRKLSGGVIGYVILALAVAVLTATSVGIVWQLLDDYRRMAVEKKTISEDSVRSVADGMDSHLLSLRGRVSTYAAENRASLEMGALGRNDPTALAAGIAKAFPEAVSFTILSASGHVLTGRFDPASDRFAIAWRAEGGNAIDLSIFPPGADAMANVSFQNGKMRLSLPKGRMNFRVLFDHGHQYFNLGWVFSFRPSEKAALILGVNGDILSKLLKAHQHYDHRLVFLHMTKDAVAGKDPENLISLTPDLAIHSMSQIEAVADGVSEGAAHAKQLGVEEFGRVISTQMISGTNWAVVGLSYTKNFLDASDRMQFQIALIVLVYIAVLAGLLWFYRTESKRRDKVERSMALATDCAEDAAEAKALFLANMSHELRSPLNAIIGFSELIKDETFGETRPEYKEYAGNIHESGTHLLDLINDILDMSKLEAGKATLDARVTNVAKLIEACQRLVGIRAETKGLAMVVDVDEPLPPLFADERKIRQILINLLTNAIKFTLSGGRVTTSARLDTNGDFLLEVKDTGIGIAPENIEKVLKPFGQLASKLGDKQQGTGLGLPLTRSFVTLHGGTLTVESAIGKGTTVIARFPASRVIALEQKARSFAG